MDKCRQNNDRSLSSSSSAAAAASVGEDSLLPPTRRVANNAASPLTRSPAQDKRSSKKWSIDGLFRKLSSILDAHSSSSLEEPFERHHPRYGGKSKDDVSKSSGYAFKSREGIDYSPAAIYCNNNDDNVDDDDDDNNDNSDNNDNNNNNENSDEDLLNANMNQSQSLDALEARLTGNSVYSRSSDGSLEAGGTRRLRKDKVKARVEAKRDQLCVGDSSMDESSTEEPLGNAPLPKAENSNGKRRSRASRNERYFKRIVNASVKPHPSIADVHKLLLIAQVNKQDVFQRIDRAHKSQTTTSASKNGKISLVSDSSKENLYASQSDIGVNPLVQQTLQYFSKFDHHMDANHHNCHYHHQQQQRMRKTYPTQQHHRRGTLKSQVHPDSSHGFDDEVSPSTSLVPPKPPSRDHTSRVLINGTPMDKYQQMLGYVQRPPSETQFINAESYTGTSLSKKENSEVRSANNNSAQQECLLSLSPPKSPLRESLNMATVGVTKSLIERNQSPLLDLNQAKYRSQPLSPQDYHNLNYVPHNKLGDTMKNQLNDRQSSKNLEEALCELEAIYNSLQLGDEELLERAEKRTMEEFHYKGLTASLHLHGNEDSASRRKVCTDQTSSNYREMAEAPDRLKDDMAYRRMHPKERPPSTDGQSFLSSISYLMTSPIPSRRDMRYIDPKRKSCRKEPDVALDDVVFRSMQYANNTLKVVEPQPPFGIPLGPITTATESDYLHTNPMKSERSRSPYIPSCEPDLVTDDLAFRNLRKDALSSGSSRQPSPSLLHGSIIGSSNCTSPLSFGLKKRRAVRSLSANLYGLINKPTLSTDFDARNQTSIADDFIFDDFFNDVPVKHISRRTSDPELMCPNWHKNTGDRLNVNRNKSKEEEERRTSQKQAINCLDVDLSNGSYDESSDERILTRDRLIFAQRDGQYKAVGSDMSSSYLSSNCSTPPPPPSMPARSAEPFTEQEISIYQKLCQDLENLVQLTKDIDGISTCEESAVITFSSIPTSDVIIIQKESSVSDIENMTADDTLDTKNSSKFKIVQTREDSVDIANINSETQTETSPVKRKISIILDNLKNLREESDTITSSFSDEDSREKDGEGKNPLTDDKSLIAITKEICDMVARADIKKHGLAMKVKEKESEVDKLTEDNDNKDRVEDSLFFRDIQLAKLSGDWKESTSNNNGSRNAVIANDRRTSLTSGDSSSNWEGMTKCNHKYNSMPAKTSSLLPFRHGSKRKSSNRKSMCTVS
ncbi:uncharacterized protein LOC100678870 isoform X2 [Nasonia vitripennis]|uniref:Uncharacterized protein n=1 Tax=Nasonia vitripennis TaxID=7425 RepID=A0A7M7PYF6_NASVI|nr:uncharacterized protein LOC100678870 isoform X2 [Nasonia vitripennis]